MIALPATVVVVAGYLLWGDTGIFISGAVMILFFMLLGVYFLFKDVNGPSSQNTTDKKDTNPANKKRKIMITTAFELIGFFLVIMMLWRASIL
ncbi:MAG: hypothetical protein LBJ20_00985 [Candidatus Methanoplasma sp.]|jgi:hypothetical protein|nr:hypothetical protein [Candidatus Methanoplasma sp.]